MRKLSTKKKIKKSKGKNDEAVLPDSNENIDEEHEANENGGKSDSSADDADDEKEKAPKRKNKDKKDEKDRNNTTEEEDGDLKSEASETKSEEEYEVQDVVGHKIEKGVSFYLIRWKGYDSDGDTWEPEDTLSCPELISKFKKKGKRSSNGKGGKAKKKIKIESTKEKSDPDKEWEVERIIDVADDKKDGRLFRIRWKGYKASSDTWEPEEHLNCKDLIEKFLKKQEESSDGKELREEPKRTQRFATDAFGRRASKRNSGRSRTVYYDAE